MRGLRFSVVAGAATLIGGIYCKEKFSMSNYVMPSGTRTPSPGNTNEYNPISSVARTGENSLPNYFFNASDVYSFRPPITDKFLQRENYFICFDQKNKIPKYVVERLTITNMQSHEGLVRSKKLFEEDSFLPELYSPTLSDYKDSSYDKGHMARASNHMQDSSTYLLSNIAPQVHSFNAGIWDKLEQYANNFVKSYDEVYVWTGSLFIPKKCPDGKFRVAYEVIGNNVAVPTHFFKVILGIKDSEVVMESYVVEHKDIKEKKSVDLKECMRDKVYIEKYAGYRIFEDLPADKLKKVNKEYVKNEEIRSKL